MWCFVVRKPARKEVKLRAIPVLVPGLLVSSSFICLHCLADSLTSFMPIVSLQSFTVRQCPGNQESSGTRGGGQPSSSDKINEGSDSGSFSSGEGAASVSSGGSGGDGRKPFPGWPGNRVFFQLYLGDEWELLLEFLALLVAAGVPLELIKDNSGCNLLHLTCRDGYLGLVKYLVRHMPINNTDNQGWTPLHYASYNNHFAIVLTLILQSTDLAADLDAHPEGTFETPAACARTQEMLDFIRCCDGAGPRHPGDNWCPGPGW